ncbi:hypothetical protein CTEN210_13613 [Chaetoceros tenuissimus]|uniref:Leucine-rich repeat domain-containing protein n=1 Tax=Chaetoceros tenuissimus TaxID=426638 RepID=A0AAD3HAX4_9STRA|nr:hypothetical protein CTEN210_13613 [Chaetoceros tenuissimus]
MLRISTEEWQEIERMGPGVREYKGKNTLFWNGEELWEYSYSYRGRVLVHSKDERDSWQVIIVMPGVEEIRENSFVRCLNIEAVIMADSITWVGHCAFENCKSLVFIKLSRNLISIGQHAFQFCESLTSIFIPPSCTEIIDFAFASCAKLRILSIPQHTQLWLGVFYGAAFTTKSPFEINNGYYSLDSNDPDREQAEIVPWIRSINNEEKYTLHRLCCSHVLEMNDIQTFVEREGLLAMTVRNSIGVTPSEYLEANPYLKVKEKQIIKDFILRKMGELV